MAKKLLVKDILDIMDSDQVVNCVFYAYGVYYASSLDDGMQTPADCKKGLRYDCLNALVKKINPSQDGSRQVIHAEIVH